jgi:beta-lactamase class D
MMVSTGRAGPVLVLTSTENQEAPEFQGPAGWLDQGRCPASSFKAFLAWVALEEGLAEPGTRLHSADKHVPASPRAITLHQAMYYSSNDYFVQLFEKMPQARIDDYLLRSGLAGVKVPVGWRTSARSLISGGNLLVSPRTNHAFMCKMAFGKLTSKPSIQSAWESVMRWPGPEAKASDPNALRLYGKTGTFSGAVWFNGFGDDGIRRVCTVFLPGSVPERPAAIGAFYRIWKLDWNPAWQDWLER